MSQIGRKLVLHSVPFPDLEKKETDRFVIIEIIETKDVPDMWCNKTHKNHGWKAKSEDGRYFFCNWSSFPSDSMTPAWIWYEANENHKGFKGEWYDITMVRNAPGLPPELKDNDVVGYCEKHRKIYEIDGYLFPEEDAPNCFDCYLDWKYPEKREKMVHGIKEGPWKGWI